MGNRLNRLNANLHHYGFYALLHIVILVVSVLLIVTISIDTFKNLAFYNQPKFMQAQFWVCILFLGDFFIEFFLAPRKGHYLATHWIFFLVSIPWLSIINHFGWHFSPHVQYVLQFIPLVRGGYALAIVVGWFTSNRATSLFWSYLITLLATVYFSSLAFYLFEHHVNPLVKDYYSALWWAFMDVTTVGSNIVAVTPVGRVLSVVLAALGMMMFPIFTVYVTDKIKKLNEDPSDSILNLSLNKTQQAVAAQAATAQASADSVAVSEENEAAAEANGGSGGGPS